MAKKQLALVFLLIAVVLTSSAGAANLIINGDFESGNIGFNTDYSYSPDDITPPTTYALLTDPHLSHPAAVSYGDHTTGDGLMMAINGSTNGSNAVWEQQVNVITDQDYTLSTWLSNWTSSYAAVLDFQINGSSIGTFTQGGSGVWGEFNTIWNSGINSTALIQIYDLQGAYNGNDFAIDDISFTGPATTHVPVPPTLILLLTGFVGILSHRQILN